jgi:hypothetical protein
MDAWEMLDIEKPNTNRALVLSSYTDVFNAFTHPGSAVCIFIYKFKLNITRDLQF